MKRLLSLFLSLSLLVSLMTSALAVGNGNIDGGGGDMGGATEHGSWNPGDEGIRVTVVQANDRSVVAAPIDLTNKSPGASIYHFGKVSKLQYNSGKGLSYVRGGYSCIAPPQSIPRVISTNGTNNIPELKRYFCSEFLVELIANHTGMDYDTLINGSYKLMLEPLAFFKYGDATIAATATECALYDQAVNGDLRYWMGTLTHQNLPFAMYLETADLGYPAWSGATRGKQTNSDILAALGLGIVRFQDAPTEPPVVNSHNYTYRVDTDVITSVEVSGGQSDPDNPVTVRFTIGGQTYTVGEVYYPNGDSQLAWVKWHTPSMPCTVTISVSVSGGGHSQSTITASIVDLAGNDPPNPVADDRNDSFTPASVPNNPEVTSASWGIWSPWWKENWVWTAVWEQCWHSDWVDTSYTEPDGTRVSDGYWDDWYHWVDNGYWEDKGWWEFDYDSYSASLSVSMNITPDNKSPSATVTTLKSGYGIQQNVDARVTTNQSAAVTAAQTSLTYFPEFAYQTYWRLLDRTVSGRNSSFEFKRNRFSTYQRRTHFLPIWFPDGAYTPYTHVLDCWTPAGMLSCRRTGTVSVRGNLWEEWHIAPSKP